MTIQNCTFGKIKQTERNFIIKNINVATGYILKRLMTSGMNRTSAGTGSRVHAEKQFFTLSRCIGHSFRVINSCEHSLPYITHAFHIAQLRPQLANELIMIPNAIYEQSRSKTLHLVLKCNGK